MLRDFATPCPAADCRRLVTTEIETPRLLLRRPVAADIPAIARLANDRAIATMTRLPHPYRRDHAASFVSTLPAPEHGLESAWLIEHLGEAVGMIGFSRHARPGFDLRYWMGRPHDGQGFATEAAQSVVAALFARTRAEVITAEARVANTASRSVLQKCGFVWSDCVLQRAELLGCSVPVDRFRLTRRDWAART
jgi:RimJ/RimL family protein N-acetyltransferase